jgi:hypothetical protein
MSLPADIEKLVAVPHVEASCSASQNSSPSVWRPAVRQSSGYLVQIERAQQAKVEEILTTLAGAE